MDSRTIRAQVVPADRPFLLDVSRLVWRTWSRRLPTGIDRVCHAYVDDLGDRALAVIQRGGFQWTLNAQTSDALFALLRSHRSPKRRDLAAVLARGLFGHRRSAIGGKMYLNVGHTGLNTSGLVPWIRRHRLCAVMLIHDLIPITHPQYCRAGEAERHRRRMRTALECAAGLIANSRATLDSLAAFGREQGLGLPASLIAPLGADIAAEPGPAPVPDRPYFVMVGTIEARKNHAFILRLWESLVQRLGLSAPMLVIVGQRGWEADEAFAMLDGSSIMQTHVRELGRCSDGALSALLRDARALLMPSLAEGFGLPVAEALARGVPVLASDLPVYREFAGDIPLYLAADDSQAWDQAICAYAGGGADRQRQIARMASFSAPTWADHFQAVNPWLETLAQQWGSSGAAGPDHTA